MQNYWDSTKQIEIWTFKRSPICTMRMCERSVYSPKYMWIRYYIYCRLFPYLDFRLYLSSECCGVFNFVCFATINYFVGIDYPCRWHEDGGKKVGNYLESGQITSLRWDDFKQTSNKKWMKMIVLGRRFIWKRSNLIANTLIHIKLLKYT